MTGNYNARSELVAACAVFSVYQFRQINGLVHSPKKWTNVVFVDHALGTGPANTSQGPGKGIYKLIGRT